MIGCIHVFLPIEIKNEKRGRGGGQKSACVSGSRPSVGRMRHRIFLVILVVIFSGRSTGATTRRSSGRATFLLRSNPSRRNDHLDLVMDQVTHGLDRLLIKRGQRSHAASVAANEGHDSIAPTHLHSLARYAAIPNIDDLEMCPKSCKAAWLDWTTLYRAPCRNKPNQALL